jgi:hypothetical protein
MGGSLFALVLPSVLGCSGNGHIGDSQVDDNERQQQKFVHKDPVLLLDVSLIEKDAIHMPTMLGVIKTFV